MKKVYLAGPIGGLTYDEAEGWREQLRSWNIPGVQLFSPLRGKTHTREERDYDGDTLGDRMMSTGRAVMLRDSHDCFTADILVVNFLGAKRISIGTVMELAWAYDRRIPTIVVMEERGNVHEHAMLNEAIWWRVSNLVDAADMLRIIANP